MRLHSGYDDHWRAGAQRGSDLLVIRDSAGVVLSVRKLALHEALVESSPVLSMLSGLAAQAVPLYVVSALRPDVVPARACMSRGVY